MAFKNPFSRGRKPARGTKIVKRTRRDGGYDEGYYNGTSFILIDGTTGNGSDYIYGTDAPSGTWDGASITSDNNSGSDQGYSGTYSDPAPASHGYSSGSDSYGGGYGGGSDTSSYSGGYSSDSGSSYSSGSDGGSSSYDSSGSSGYGD